MRESSSPGYICNDKLLAAAAGALVYHTQLQLLAAAEDHTAPASADVGVVHCPTPQLGLSSGIRGSSLPGYICIDQLLATAAGALV